MIKKIDEQNTLYYKLLFPLKKQEKIKNFNKNYVVITFGGNIKNVYWTFKKAFNFLNNHPSIKIIQTSPILKNPPFGYLKQDYFLNCVIILKISIQSNIFLRFILNIEKKLGRVRLFKNSPRTLDIDILFFQNKKISNKFLTIPHYDWKNRKSINLLLNSI